MTAPDSSGSDTPASTGTTQRGYLTDSVQSLVAPDDQLVILLVSQINRATLQAIRYARAISTEVIALHIAANAETDAALRDRWEQCAPETPLIIMPAGGRSAIPAIAGYVDAILEQHHAVTVIIAETIYPSWLSRLRQMQTTMLIRYSLRLRQNVVVTMVRSK